MVLGHTIRSSRLGLQLTIIRNLHHGAGWDMLANHQWLQGTIFSDDESLTVGCSYNEFTSTGKLFHGCSDNVRLLKKSTLYAIDAHEGNLLRNFEYQCLF